jgi:hypothetical protein
MVRSGAARSKAAPGGSARLHPFGGRRTGGPRHMAPSQPRADLRAPPTPAMPRPAASPTNLRPPEPGRLTKHPRAPRIPSPHQPASSRPEPTVPPSNLHRPNPPRTRPEPVPNRSDPAPNPPRTRPEPVPSRSRTRPEPVPRNNLRRPQIRPEPASEPTSAPPTTGPGPVPFGPASSVAAPSRRPGFGARANVARAQASSAAGPVAGSPLG